MTERHEDKSKLPTPRTDELAKSMPTVANLDDMADGWNRLLDLSRQLERELAEAKQERDHFYDYSGKLLEQLSTRSAIAPTCPSGSTCIKSSPDCLNAGRCTAPSAIEAPMKRSTIRYTPAGSVTNEQRQAAHDSGLAALGDCRLIWVNEGDFWPWPGATFTTDEVRQMDRTGVK